VGEVAGDRFDAEGTNAVEVGLDGHLGFAGVLGERGREDGRGVDEGVVEDFVTGVVEDLFDVLRGREAERFVGLSHEIADEDARGAGGGEGFGNSADEKIGDERGVEGAGAEGDQIGGGDGFERLGKRGGVCGREHEFSNSLAAGGDAGFALDERAIFHARGERGVGGGGGEDAAADGENLRGELHGLREISGDAGESGDEEIAEVVTLEVSLGESVLEELREEVLILRKRDHTVADIAGREHVEFFAESARRATIVRDGDDSREAADEAGELQLGRDGRLRVKLDIGVAWRGDVALEPAEEGG